MKTVSLFLLVSCLSTSAQVIGASGVIYSLPATEAGLTWLQAESAAAQRALLGIPAAMTNANNFQPASGNLTNWASLATNVLSGAGSTNITDSGTSILVKGGILGDNAVLTNTLQVLGKTIFPASTLQTISALATIVPTSYANRVVGSNSLAVVLTSTPEVTTNAIVDGTEIRILGTSDSYTVTLNDSRTAAGAGSGLLMEAPTMVLYNGGVISFRYSSALNQWKEMGRSQNGSMIHQFSNVNISTNLTVPCITQTPQVIATSNIVWSAGNTFTRTMAGSEGIPFHFSGATAGQWITVVVTASTLPTVTWEAVTWKDAVTPSQTASKTDIYTFFYNGATYYGTVAQNF